MNTDDLKKLIRDIPDFPEARYSLPRHHTADRQSTRTGRDRRSDRGAVSGPGGHGAGNRIAGLQIGAPVAYRLGVGLTIARKQGKLPYETVSQTYDLEYGTAALEVHRDGLPLEARVLIVDDLLATGGTAAAAAHLVSKLGRQRARMRLRDRARRTRRPRAYRAVKLLLARPI